MLQKTDSRRPTRCSLRWKTPRSRASRPKTRARKAPHCRGVPMVSMAGAVYPKRKTIPRRTGPAGRVRRERGAPSWPTRSGAPRAVRLLFQVAVDQLGHLEHADGILAVEDRLELGIGPDRPLVLGILEVVGPDVVPDALGDLGARYGLGADHRGERGVRLEGSGKASPTGCLLGGLRGLINR